MFIPDPDFSPSRIPDLQQKREVKKNLLSYLFGSNKYQKIENYFVFELVKKKNWGRFTKNYRTLPKRLPLSSQKYTVDLGS
jgi:hypothetical protein